ncbi:MAG TPA: hypothetical protein DCS93_20290 [Microscillaceae bacterium]|nr:hypothetical protein [Microscillaceae bacterium]
MNVVEYIELLVAQNHLEQALEKLLEISSKYYRKDVLGAMNNFQTVKRATGVDQDNKRSRLVDQIQNLLKYISRDLSPEAMNVDYTDALAAINAASSNAPSIDTPETPTTPTSPQGKTSILFLCANPDPTAQLNFDKEVNKIELSLKLSNYRDKFSFHNKRAVNGDIIRAGLRDYKPEVVHFSGHGAGEEGIIILDEFDEPTILSNQALNAMFKIYKTHVKCVVLNACYSEEQARIIKQHIPYVIGMSDAIEDSTSIAFSKGFYEALGDNKTYPEAFEEGKLVILMENMPGADIPQLFE